MFIFTCEIAPPLPNMEWIILEKMNENVGWRGFEVDAYFLLVNRAK